MSSDFHADETVIAPSGSESLIGRIIGHYKVTDVLGKGGFGAVYKAEDLKLGRTVALKFLRQTNEEFHAELFEREARALGALGKHPNILQIFTWDEYKGANFFALEYMSRSVADEMKLYPEGMPIDMAVRIIAQCADALAFAHESQILHRDIKAQNILLEERDGTAKIADFGLARICGPSSNTIEGQAIGSPVYMAPEQARGQQLTHLCDIYSLGVTLYELLCGKPSVSGSSILEVLEKVRNNDRVPLRAQKPGLPDALYAIVDRATAPEPANRYQSSTDMAADLRKVSMPAGEQMTGSTAEATTVGAPPLHETISPLTTSAAEPVTQQPTASKPVAPPAQGQARAEMRITRPPRPKREKPERRQLTSVQKGALAVVLGCLCLVGIGIAGIVYTMVANGGSAPYMDNYYQDDGYSGYYDIDGNPISNSTILFDSNNNYIGPVGGYYDSNGNLLGGGGYYDSNGNFIEGYYDADGFWVSTPSQYESGGKEEFEGKGK